MSMARHFTRVEMATAKPCPFCGGIPFASHWRSERDEELFVAEIECLRSKCPVHLSTYESRGDHRTAKAALAEVVEAWNKRA